MTRVSRPLLAVPVLLLPTVLAGAAHAVGDGPLSARDRSAARPTAPVTAYEMPFPCGEAWTGSTREGHSPSRWSIDWNRADDADDPVVAAAAGTVVRAESTVTSGYGRWVMLEHLDGERTVYAHLETVAVTLDQSVDQGTLLGTVGTTGNSSGTHLHFEERTAAGVVPPYFHGVAFDFGTTQVSQNCPDTPVAGNLLAGPEAEVGVFRRTAKAQFVVEQPGGEPLSIRFGNAQDQPVLGDWDADGVSDLAVRAARRPVFRLRTAAGVTRVRYGVRSDAPVAGDWDGDGAWEIGVRRAADSAFLLRGADGSVQQVTLGDADDLPVTGDWDGDGITDLAVFDRESATFTLRLVDDDGLTWTARVDHGEPGDLPVAGDWDGDGTTDLGTWTPATATFHLRTADQPTAARARVSERVFGTPR